jgi:predicted nucleic acid-binding protein
VEDPMNNIVVDTNPLVYIYHDVPDFGNKYATRMGELAKGNILVIPKIVYGELSLAFQDDKELDAFLRDTGVTIGEINQEAYLTAARRWEKYNKRRVLICQICGKRIENLTCKQCNAEIKIRQHILTDFIIGAYALQMERKQLVSSDIGYYSTYYPELNIISVDV